VNVHRSQLKSIDATYFSCFFKYSKKSVYASFFACRPKWEKHKKVFLPLFDAMAWYGMTWCHGMMIWHDMMPWHDVMSWHNIILMLLRSSQYTKDRFRVTPVFEFHSSNTISCNSAALLLHNIYSYNYNSTPFFSISHCILLILFYNLHVMLHTHFSIYAFLELRDCRINTIFYFTRTFFRN
jgi:hypothetical protein